MALPWKAAAAGMVDRLSPIDRSLKTEWPLRKAAEKTSDYAACASGRAIGDNGSTMPDSAACASGRAIEDNGSTMEDDSAKLLLDRS